MMFGIRESIKKQLESSYLIDMLAKAVLHFNDTDLKCIASLCRQDYTALTIKINMLKKKKSYLDKKEKMETAVKDVFHKIDYLSVAAFKHELDIEELEKVYHNWLNSEDSVSYEYDEDKNEIFTFVEESLLFKQLYRWEKNCKCPCQVCAMEQLQSIAYCIAKKKNKCPETWLKCEKADLSWLSNFIMEYIEEIFKLNGPDECIIDSQTSSTLQSFIFNREIEEISDLIILYPHVQNKPSQLSNVQVISDIREKIVRHLEMSPWLNKAAKEVLYENKNITDVALKYNLDFWIFKRKLEIIKETNIYVNVKNKYENAICTIVNQNASLTENAKIHCINKKHLEAEFMKYLQLRRKTRKSYTYDQIINPNGIFTASQEKSLLQLLNSWKRCLFKCSCQVCTMEHLLKLTYSFAKMNKILYPSEWDINEEADEFWFCEFEMRYSIEIKTQFVFAHSCTKELSASQLSLSFIRPKISEINTLHVQVQEDFEPLQSSNADVTKNDNVQKRIATHLKWSSQLDKAAEKVLNENKYIASVARDYKLDLWLLNRKVYILKFKRTQLDTKNKIESSLNDIKYNNISTSCAAKKYNIDEEIIEENWEQWRNLESNIITYEAFTMDDEIFTFSQESILLEQLQQDTKNLNCNCQICVLEYLRSMAYRFATQTIDKRCPVEWHAIAKADELWIYEFEMRHNIEISKYRQCDHLDHLEQPSLN
ncbi:uncharacterized protein LOC114928390 [Nylanderia fulva]|uniref:uncharacterized protein LOC114928390 n=1 Tax=Nylanderia fulva TaxID=613905 RepID=UPI0010FB3D11|nr:uncharacterized protein LOC114928390 [Nylanderia fulva]